MSANPPPPPVPSSPPGGGAVRRHHTITASSRPTRAAARESVVVNEDNNAAQDQGSTWDEDEVVDQDWRGGVGAVGEKTSLHRQHSLPTKYHRGQSLYRAVCNLRLHLCSLILLFAWLQLCASKAAAQTQKTVNSLAAIAGHEGDEEPWNLADDYQVEDEQHPDHPSHVQGVSEDSPLSPHFAAPLQQPSPPPTSGAGVRRHVSLTYGASAPRKMSTSATAGLKRSGTLQAAGSHGHHSAQPTTVAATARTPPPEATAEGPEEDDYAYDGVDPDTVGSAGGYEDDYARAQQQQQQYIAAQQAQAQQYQVGRQSPWGQHSGGDWRGGGSVDDVQRALSALDINNQQQGGQGYPTPGLGNFSAGQSAHPPRFNPPSSLTPGGRGGGYGGGHNNGRSGSEYEGRKTPVSAGGNNGGYYGQGQDSRAPGGDRNLHSRNSNPNLSYGYQQQGGPTKNAPGSGGIPSVPPIPAQYLQQQQRGFGQQGGNGAGAGAQGQGGAAGDAGYLNGPVDVPSLIAQKNYNPTQFDIRPQNARYFVIKSYTEDDVHKSLKYEIWSSTDPGNKRLDKAFKESAGRGPIYLFFSVNASGHFCGMAEMLTPVDYTKSSNVWASDKWKGVFQVRWIFVRDIPNVNLRHIKLNNTQERKPVTNSRDTQELLPDAGQEMLRIFHTHPARTSLLQDFAFYELQSMQKMQPGGSLSPPHSPDPNNPSSAGSPQLQNATPNFGLSSSPEAMGYAMPPQMSPMLQMQMMAGMGMGGMGSMGGMGGMGAMGGMGNMSGMGGMGGQFGMPSQTQAMHQSVMRHPPGSAGANNNGNGQGQGGVQSGGPGYF